MRIDTNTETIEEKSITEVAGDKRSQRYFFLDWLRVITILLVFLFHCARFFDDLWWHIKDTERSPVVNGLVMVLTLWGMPLFFLIAGAATRFSFTTGMSMRRFLMERSLRLMVPFIFGVLVIVPPQVYFERLQKQEFAGSYLQFYPHYFSGLYFFGGNFSWIGHHLWFLLALFIITIITLPTLRFLQSGRGAIFISRLARLCEQNGSVLLLALPIIFVSLVLRAIGLSDPLNYLLFFFYGYIIFSDPRFAPLIINSGRTALIIAIVSSFIYGQAFYAGYLTFDELGHYSIKYIFYQLLAGLNAWCWTVALLAIGMNYLQNNSKFLKYAGEAVMPFYVIHQTVIILAGYYIIQLQRSIVTKYLLISSLSLVITIALYEVVVKRVNVIRFLFGMKSK